MTPSPSHPSFACSPCVAASVGSQALTLHRLESPPSAVLLELSNMTSPPPGRPPKFPGPNPVSLDRSHFGALASQAYVACEKTDGVRMLLVCCRVDGVNLVALVDRAHAWYVFPVRRVPKAMFQGSLLDGELAWNKRLSAWEYLVFDAVCVSGIPVLECRLSVRLAAAARALEAYTASPQDPASVRLKRFVPCTQPADVQALVAAARESYDVDGLILTPAAAPVVYGRHMGMFKLKSGSQHTVDFLVGRNGQDLLVFDHGRHVRVASLAPNAYAKAGGILECVPSASAEHWDVVGVRTDKSTANDMFTYRKTLLNIREALTWDVVAPVFRANSV